MDTSMALHVAPGADLRQGWRSAVPAAPSKAHRHPSLRCLAAAAPPRRSLLAQRTLLCSAQVMC